MSIQTKSFALLFLLVQAFSCSCAFVATEQASCFSPPSRTVSVQSALSASSDSQDASRRSLLGSAFLLPATLTFGPASAFAASREPLPEVLYRILRVREATQQETRLIKSGKFKDVQRANVKLAVRFMVENYRLNDAFVTASAYLNGSSARRVEAGQIGTRAVQNLYTILEYFDSSDVQNIKVGAASMAGKEELVLKGLDATRKSIDDFLAYFPKEEVDKAAARIKEENDLNVKEFDPEIGTIINLPLPQ